MGNLSALANNVVQTTPVGVIEAFAGVNAPAGWLFCDGSAISRIQYPELFSALSTTYGSGDGSTTFNLPDLRGRMPFGKGTHSDVASLGQNEGASLANRRPKHQHTVYFSDPGHGHSMYATQGNYGTENGFPFTGRVVFSRSGGPGEGNGYNFSDSALYGRVGTTGINIKVNPENATSSTSPSDAPPYLVVNYIIKAVADLPRGGWFYQNQPPVVTQLPSNPQIGEEVYYYSTTPIAGYQRQRWDGSAWSVLSDSRWQTSSATNFLSASSTTVVTGSFGGNITYTQASITLTPGQWLVQTQATIINTSTSDGTNVGIWNVTSGAEVANSRGPAHISTTSVHVAVSSRKILMNVAANTTVCPLGCRNGSSTIQMITSAGAPAGAIWAQRIFYS